MNGSRGQALVELAVCLPVVLVLALGATAVVQVVDADTGLRAAAAAAISAAARAPDLRGARAEAEVRFSAVIADYPVRSAQLHLELGSFGRGTTIEATATGYVDLGWASIALLPAHLQLRASDARLVEPWRSRS
jgi:hypothetical protein